MRSLNSATILGLLVGLISFHQSVVGAAGFDYGDALDKSLTFFKAQRSGKLPADKRVNWRRDSGLKDGFLQGVDLVGGYYDAGDHVKFGLPMAFTVTMLSWGCIEFSKEMAGLNQLDRSLEAIRWGTDYFIKAHKQPNVLWGQVGDGDSDHYCWERAEDMTTPRTAYKIDSNNPGSDLAGETAAAMAAACIAFKRYDSAYSQLLLVHAKQLFSFADRFRGRYDDSITSAKKFYPSASGYSVQTNPFIFSELDPRAGGLVIIANNTGCFPDFELFMLKDELLWAAAWLYQATDDEYYLKYVVDNAANMGGTGWAVREFSWDNEYAGLQVLLAKVLMDGKGGAYTPILKQYQAKAEFFLCACMQKNNGYNVDMTPGGLLFVDDWNNMQYVSSAAFLLTIYSGYLSKANAQLACPEGKFPSSQLLEFAQSQADYILGKNPKSMSYLVGYGSNYPGQVHHRGASIESISILPATVGCLEGFERWYDMNGRNPNVITGALVGGPNQKDEYNDQRWNYEQTEPSLASNAPLVGLFAKLNGAVGSASYSPPAPHASNPAQAVDPVEWVHKITNTWTSGGETYHRYKVIIENKSGNAIKELKLKMEDLSGSLWGLSPVVGEKDTFHLPPWIQVLQPGSQCTFTYVQGGPQAKISILSYN
ncbi:hypothetical protein ACLOJK_017153 [Asimina triloba]